MKVSRIVILIIATVCAGPAVAQESKPVPKDSVRVFIPGCSRGYMFTVGPHNLDQPGSSGLPEGMHLRMNAPKKTMAEIAGHEGSMIEISGLMKRNDLSPDGVGNSRIRIMPGPTPSAGGSLPSPAGHQILIDVESWRQVAGECPTR